MQPHFFPAHCVSTLFPTCNLLLQVTSWGDFSSLESNPPGMHVQPLYRSPHGDSLVELALGMGAKQHQHRLLEDRNNSRWVCFGEGSW